MKIKKSTKVIGVLGISACLLITCLYILSSGITFEGKKNNAQGVYSRIMVDNVVLLQNSFSLDFDLSHLLYHKKKIYISNFIEKSISILDSSGRVIQKIGRKGNAPGEFQSITDLSLIGDTIRVIDKISSLISDFDNQGNVIYSYKYNKHIVSGIRLDAKSCAIKIDDPGSAEEETFEIVNIISGEKKAMKVKRNPINQDASIRDLQVDGGFIANGKGQFFRFSHRAGQFISFDSNGRFLYHRETIDASPLPIIHQKISGGMTIIQPDANARTINLDATADTQYLYILSNAASHSIKDIRPGVTDERVVDVYNVLNGDYICSFILPKYKDMRAASISAAPDGIFAIYKGNTIVHYTVKLKRAGI